MSVWDPADATSYYFLISRVSAIRQKYEAEDTQYERFSDFINKKAEESREEGKLEKKHCWQSDKIGIRMDQIIAATGLSQEEIEDLV